MKLHRALGVLSLIVLPAWVMANDGRLPHGTAARAGNLELTGVLTAQGAPFPGTKFSVLRAESGAFGKTRFRVLATSGPQAAATFRLNPGRYRIQARNGAATADEFIEVPARGVLRHEVVLDAGELHLDSLMDQDGTAAGKTWFRVLREETDSYGRPVRVQVAGDGYAQSAGFVLPAGRYVAEATYGDTRVEVPVQVTAGRATHQTLVLDAGRLELTATLDENGARAAGATFRVMRRTDNGTAASGWRQVAEAAAPDGIAFVLPSGDYRVRAELDQAVAQTTLTLEAGEMRSVDLPLNAGELSVRTTLSGREEALLDAWFGVRPVHGAAGQAAETSPRGPLHEARFVLPAGRYLATARVGQSQHSLAVVVEPGSSQTAVITQPAGRVRLTLVSGPRDRLSEPAWFSVYRVETDRHGGTRHRRVFNDGYFLTTEMVLPAGRYVAFARRQGRRGELRFDLHPGDLKTLSFVAGD